MDATFYDRHELKGRDISEVSHPVVQDTVKELEGCAAEMVLNHALLRDSVVHGQIPTKDTSRVQSPVATKMKKREKNSCGKH